MYTRALPKLNDGMILGTCILVFYKSVYSQFHWYVERGGDRNASGMPLENTFDIFLKPSDSMGH